MIITKSIVIISDLHCGSVFGLTPPKWWTTHHRALQEEAWCAYRKMTKKWAFPDVLLVNGDAIEGAQTKQGGAECITTDRNVQSDMAYESIRSWNAGNILMTYGSKYHVGDNAEDFEYNIAQRLQATIEGRLYFKIEKMVVDARHKIGTSGVPQGRATSLLKEMAWGLIRATTEAGPKVDMLIRSHCHYHVWVEQPGRVMFTTPALQLSRGRYGSRECIGETHWGAIRLLIKDNQIVGKDVMIWKLAANKPRLLKLR